MPCAVKKREFGSDGLLSRLKTGSVSALFLCSLVVLSGCGAAQGVLDRLPDLPEASEEPEVEDEQDAARAKLLEELKALRAELQKRSGRLTADLAEAKAELVRRQAAGEIDQAKVNLSPAQIRDEQLNQLEALKAELERRRLAKDNKQRIVTAALTANETAYQSIDQCLSSGTDFREAFVARKDLDQIVDEGDNKVYRNTDRSLLLLASKDTCDVSFRGGNLKDYTLGLVHILETQGGIVKQKELAGLTVISVAHPRGNFRLASGNKVIGSGSATNLYTTISAVKG